MSDRPHVVLLSLPLAARLGNARRMAFVKVAFADDRHHRDMERDHYAPIFHVLFDWVDRTTAGAWRAYDMPVHDTDCESDDDEPEVSVVSVAAWRE
ncbi:hypothetical protein ml_236 [Mollivirus sibericum]|uniref:hypothetical protein n=1 Tax=Mollivirus sibericum TaxID=1678078 RepID=UPI0006B2E9A8|nr:hypothetical protein ml_236 [Mollivirus sibericum]ALD62038.1 hypothetical protein ml_236 [Mollivirus sibericum]